MSDIWFDEMDEFKNDLETGEFKGVKYMNSWNYEEDYSEEDIQKNRDRFIREANKYLYENNYPYVVREICNYVSVCDDHGIVIV